MVYGWTESIVYFLSQAKCVKQEKVFRVLAGEGRQNFASGVDHMDLGRVVTWIDSRIVGPINRTISSTVHGENDWRYHDKTWWLRKGQSNQENKRVTEGEWTKTEKKGHAWRGSLSCVLTNVTFRNGKVFRLQSFRFTEFSSGRGKNLNRNMLLTNYRNKMRKLSISNCRVFVFSVVEICNR